MSEQWVVVGKDGWPVDGTNSSNELTSQSKATFELRYKLNIREWWELADKGYRCIKVEMKDQADE